MNHASRFHLAALIDVPVAVSLRRVGILSLLFVVLVGVATHLSGLQLWAQEVEPVDHDAIALIQEEALETV